MAYLTSRVFYQAGSLAKVICVLDVHVPLLPPPPSLAHTDIIYNVNFVMVGVLTQMMNSFAEPEECLFHSPGQMCLHSQGT